VYQFLLEHKLEYARQLLDSGQHNVNGRFKSRLQHWKSFYKRLQKKKYGTTPKSISRLVILEIAYDTL
jgi:hypothetical protein